MTLPVLRAPSLLGRWDPLRELDDLHDRMSHLIASAFGPGQMLPTAAWTPLADVSETDDAYLVEVDVPGVQREDIAVEVTGNELVITGEYKQRERTGMARSHTRRVGSFQHRTILPGDINATGVSADLAEGVLTVRVPKSEAAKPRRITIEAH
ncbi:MAG: Hsp20/alpha crystallin family protein [Micromonosporaceae bacterium]